MRVSPALTLLAAAALALSACGGSGSSSDSGQGPVDTGQLGNTGSGKDAGATGPVSIDGAAKGGVLTVLTNTGLTTTIDPAEAYYFLSRISIQRGQGREMRTWRKRLFVGLAHNAASPTEYFHLPEDRTVAMGAAVVL